MGMIKRKRPSPITSRRSFSFPHMLSIEKY
nr:MAG TPA: hypothetical protein [Bacteriophage sp.]